MRAAGLLLLACAPLLQGAAITSAQSGSWNSGTTWVGGAIPGNGDTVGIANGTTVTVSDKRTIGVSGATGTLAIDLKDSGALVIASGGTLHVRGDAIYKAGFSNTSAAVTVQGGS